jgi:signal transduction histidine kinase
MLRCDFRVNPAVSAVQVDPACATAFFRIAQELLTNVTRHACASKTGIALAQEDGMMVLEINDDGKGISEQDIHASPSFGLLGIRERATLLGGECVIRGAPGEGTRVVVRVPVSR